MGKLGEFTKGIIKENPTFVLMLGLCPTLAVTTQIRNALAMGVAVIGVLTCSNVIISLLRKLIPKEIRIPCFIVVIASHRPAQAAQTRPPLESLFLMNAMISLISIDFGLMFLDVHYFP